MKYTVQTKTSSTTAAVHGALALKLDVILCLFRLLPHTLSLSLPLSLQLDYACIPL